MSSSAPLRFSGHVAVVTGAGSGIGIGIGIHIGRTTAIALAASEAYVLGMGRRQGLWPGAR